MSPVGGGSDVENLAGEPGSSVGAAPHASFAGVRGEHLIEIRVRRLDDVATVASLSAGVYAAVRQVDCGAVIWGDYRRASPISAQVASAWSRDMRHANRCIARSGILLDPANEMFNLQVVRVVQCAGNPSRRLFTDPRELLAWLHDQLTPDEREVLHGLIVGERGPYPAAPPAVRYMRGA
jgi:hypothetical protein